MPTELELIALRSEFDLYLAFVKRLVLDLPNCQDRTRAALWLQKLRSITKDEQLKLRNEHLKLFLFALHRRALLGVFEHKPPKDELDSFHDGLTLLEMTRELIEIAERKKTETKKKGEEGYGVCPLPPVLTNFSYDMKEYAACQQIPKFGSHIFYAVSHEPVQMWRIPEGQDLPSKHWAPNQLQWERALSKLCDHVLEAEAEMNAAMDAQKQAESGFVFDDQEEEIKKPELLTVKPCGGGGVDESSFKWKKDSKLMIYQAYDFSDVGKADDLIEQGKHQLELDENALSILDESLPGRRRVHIRVPYFKGLPADFIERRHHDVIDEIPASSCDGPPCEEETVEDEDCENVTESVDMGEEECGFHDYNAATYGASMDYCTCEPTDYSQTFQLSQNSYQCSDMQQTFDYGGQDMTRSYLSSNNYQENVFTQQPVFDQSGQQPYQVECPNYSQPNYAQPNYAQPNYAQPNYAQPNYAQPNFDQYNCGSQYGQPPYESNGYNQQQLPQGPNLQPERKCSCNIRQ